ncbi:MAG: right-handed parallel beta-helix repeat-containing protein, partial [Bacteroidales bacterium]|nr:right-handed parallel beta-helix repeat-containing protein [Bacteroidales bacterium]
MKTRTTLLLFLIGFLNLNSQTIIPDGNVAGIWELAGSPYLIEGDITLAPDDRLTIKSGVEVIFQGQYNFEIEGKLDATGTPDENIIFTIEDTTGYYLGNHIGWNGITFNGLNSGFAENSLMDYCIIEFSKQSGITCFTYPNLILTNSVFRYNNGGIILYTFSNITIENIHILENNSTGFYSENSAPYVSNFLIEQNQGRGILISGNSSSDDGATFINGQILNNITSYNGGGINISDDANVYFENVEISGNEATNGGGIYCEMAGGEFNNVKIIGNSAENGGGINCSFMSDITFNYCLIAKNMAYVIGGGAMIFDGDLELINCTISDNIAGDSGGGLFSSCYYPFHNEIQNSIIWNNLPEEIVAAAELPIVKYSDVKGGYTGIGNIDHDPLYVDADNNDYRLLWIDFPEENNSKSPCIDSGDPDST